MKKFKKLIPAFAMLLVSAVMLGTSTFAWFSMNTNVTATGMNVTATSNNPYFVISATKEDITNATGTATSATLTKESTNVQPVAYTTTQITPTTGAAINANSWYTATSNQYDASNGSTPATAQSVDLGAEGYFVTYEFYVGLAKNSTAGNFKLNVKLTQTEGANKDAIKAAVVITPCEGADTTGSAQTQVTWDTLSATSGWTADNSVEFAVGGTSNTAKFAKVTVYVYIDGTNENVKTSTGNITGSLNIFINGDIQAEG